MSQITRAFGTGMCVRHVLFVCIPAKSELPQPVNLTLNSNYVSHMLKWEPGPGTPTGVHYSVTFDKDTWVSSVFLRPVCCVCV